MPTQSSMLSHSEPAGGPTTLSPSKASLSYILGSPAPSEASRRGRKHLADLLTQDEQSELSPAQASSVVHPTSPSGSAPVLSAPVTPVQGSSPTDSVFSHLVGVIFPMTTVRRTDCSSVLHRAPRCLHKLFPRFATRTTLTTKRLSSPASSTSMRRKATTKATTKRNKSLISVTFLPMRCGPRKRQRIKLMRTTSGTVASTTISQRPRKMPTRRR
ncbi:hypothetical protein C8F01DRAFT_292259 [Mycena amicta]|nr:hypothetical protein C8F01DRAFT_292259 [Mycena amicta]